MRKVNAIFTSSKRNHLLIWQLKYRNQHQIRREWKFKFTILKASTSFIFIYCFFAISTGSVFEVVTPIDSHFQTSYRELFKEVSDFFLPGLTWSILAPMFWYPSKRCVTYEKTITSSMWKCSVYRQKVVFFLCFCQAMVSDQKWFSSIMEKVIENEETTTTKTLRFGKNIRINFIFQLIANCRISFWVSILDYGRKFQY